MARSRVGWVHGVSMADILPFRQFHAPRQPPSEFVQQTLGRDNELFAVADLAKSGLTPQNMYVDAHPLIRRRSDARAAYVIPYFDLEGKPLMNDQNELVMWRTRLLYPEFHKGSRYDQPSGEQLAKFGLPPYIPYIHPRTLTLEGDAIVCAEGEKKSATIIKYLGLPTFGIGGCQMWRDPSGSGDIHSWIKKLFELRRCTKLIIVPDGDIFRYDICNAYGTFARAAEAAGLTVEILNPGDKIDDAIVKWGSNAAAHWRALPRIAIGDLVQSPGSLVKKYQLAFRTDSKDRPVVHQHSSNIMKLMEEHPAFPKLWRNLDSNRVMIGDNIAQPDATEMDIANYFQHNLGFDKVHHRLIFACIQALAKKNAKSPMLNWIRAQNWDGISRLDTWLSRLWGIEDSAYYREIASKWLIGACARQENPGTKIDWILIVIGPQGIGKTSMPGILFSGNDLVLYGEQNDKDFHMLLHSSLVICFDELDSFGKKESSTLKAMITRHTDQFRPPYGASVEIFPRRFSLYGCGNRAEFLHSDPSGYRRYPIVEARQLLNFKGLESERSQLWAEAWTRYKSGGVRFWEVEGASEHSERYSISDPLNDQMLNWIASQCLNKAATNVKDGRLYFNIPQLLLGLNREHDNRNSTVLRDLGNLLHRKGIRRGTGKAPVPGMLGRYYEVDIEVFTKVN